MLHHELRAVAKKINNASLRRKIIELMENPTFEAGGNTFSGMSLSVSPAGLSHHHSYRGGYLEHVRSSANIALAICDSVEKIYSGKVNRDLVIAGILIHDLFKPLTYDVSDDDHYRSSRLADYLDHLSIGTAELIRRGFSLELVHIVSSHHGEYGPIRPRSIEALICHLADLTDSRLDGEVLSAARYLTSRLDGAQLYDLNSAEAFEIVRSKSEEGWDGVAKTLKKIQRRRGGLKRLKSLV